jgi:hypothetical protein
VRAQNALGLSRPSEISEPLAVTLQKPIIACAPCFDLELKDTTALENEQACRLFISFAFVARSQIIFI